ncbi:MAG TPA: hypothetical protein VFF49_11250 [Thermodesulfobacteriota bacterium]|nr:hypothetical protein [Thermodesulfobacteriota bacterium]
MNKSLRPQDKLFNDFVTRVYKNMETVITYNKSEDGLPKTNIDPYEYVDYEDRGVQSLLDE